MSIRSSSLAASFGIASHGCERNHRCPAKARLRVTSLAIQSLFGLVLDGMVGIAAALVLAFGAWCSSKSSPPWSAPSCSSSQAPAGL